MSGAPCVLYGGLNDNIITACFVFEFNWIILIQYRIIIIFIMLQHAYTSVRDCLGTETLYSTSGNNGDGFRTIDLQRNRVTP